MVGIEIFTEGMYYNLLDKITGILSYVSQLDITSKKGGDLKEKSITFFNDRKKEVEKIINSGDLKNKFLNHQFLDMYYKLRDLTDEGIGYYYNGLINYNSGGRNFEKFICQVYTEIFGEEFTEDDNTPFVLTFNDDRYFWVEPSYNIIGISNLHKSSLLSLPDLYHEIGHIIYGLPNVKETIIGDFPSFVKRKYQRVFNTIRNIDDKSKQEVREGQNLWNSDWLEEYCCDLLATYLAGESYAYANLKLSCFEDNNPFSYSYSHPSNDSRTKIIIMLLNKMGRDTSNISDIWKNYLSNQRSTQKHPYYSYLFYEDLLEELTNQFIKNIDKINLLSFIEQKREDKNPISKILNDAWHKILSNPSSYSEWEITTVNNLMQ